MNHVLVLHYHEIWLKGGNKRYFMSRLIAAIKAAVADLPLESLDQISERLILTAREPAALDAIAERLRRVFGLAYIAMAQVASSDIGEITRAACKMTLEKKPASFAVRAKIAHTDFPMGSMEVEREVGREILAALRAQNPNARVNLTKPELTCTIEVIPGRALVYVERIEGAGGLPAATGGRLVTLLSGGFDSAVAAYKMMRRGVHVSFVHFYATPSPSRDSSRPVAEQIVRVLTPYQFTSRLYRVPFDDIQRRIVAAAPERFRVLLYRRTMARIASEIARAERALGLVTGDSVSQVASQTLHNLAALDRGILLPVYRPLAGDDKEEILRWARRIGTYSISCEPFEDCCPRFMPRSPVIFSKADELDEAEAGLGVDELVTLGLEGASVVNYKFENGKVTGQEKLPSRFEKLVAQRKGDRPVPRPLTSNPRFP
jgi:tRNA uracil 4-sulfurtransferase